MAGGNDHYLHDHYNAPAENYNNQYYHNNFAVPPPNAPPPYMGTSPSYPHDNYNQHQQHHHHHAPPPPPGRYAYVAPSAPLPARHPRVIFFITIVRPWAIVAPFLTLVMDIWWFSTGRLCGGIDDVGSDCYLVLWYSMPIVRFPPVFVLVGAELTVK